MRQRTVFALGNFLAVILGWGLATSLAAPPSPEQLTKIKAADLALTRAANLYTNKKFKESAAAVDEAQKALVEVATAADKDVQKLLEPRWAKLKSSHSALELEGLTLSQIAIPTPMPPDKPAAGTPPTAKPVAGKVSFMKDVLPLMSAKCANCHMKDSKGGFNFNTFAAFQKGSKDGVVFLPGKSQGSRIVEVIESGDMPRGGGKVSKPELDMLKSWIDQGATFDGPSPMAMLTAATPGKPAMPEVPAIKLEVTLPTGKETVSFAKDIAPVLTGNCVGCHGDQNPQGKLNLDNFVAMIRGGDSGVPYLPGNSAESLLVKKLKGTAGKQMPLNKKALDNSIIAKFEKWISEGAKFDGAFGAGQKLERVVEIAKAQASTHEQLLQQRMTLGDRKWHNALSDLDPKKYQTKNFFVIGTPGNGMTVETLGDQAEQQISVVAKFLGATADTPFVKGRMTLQTFKNSIDLAEFVNTNEGRSKWSDAGFWRYDGVDAVMGVAPPASPKEYNLNALLAQNIASLYVNQIGQRTPTWFADGVGRAIASKVDAKDPRVQSWESRLPEAMGMNKPESLFSSSGASDELNVSAYGLVKSQMMANSTTFSGLLQALRKGEDFDQAVAKAYRATPQQLLAAFLRRGK